MLLQHLDRDFLVSRLRLEQHYRPDIFGFALRRVFQRLPAHDRAIDSVLPGIVFGQDDRQLYHLGGLQFLRRDAVQDV